MNLPLHLGYHVNPTLTCRLSATLSALTSIRSFTFQAFPALWAHIFILSQVCMNYWPIISVLLFINPVIRFWIQYERSVEILLMSKVSSNLREGNRLRTCVTNCLHRFHKFIQYTTLFTKNLRKFRTIIKNFFVYWRDISKLTSKQISKILLLDKSHAES